MYNVQEVSEILEVSKQTVYSYLKKYSKELKTHIIKKNGARHIDEEGLTIIKMKTGIIEVPTIQENNIDIDDIVGAIVKGLKEEMEEQNKQLMLQNDLKIEEIKEELQQVKEQNKELLYEIKTLKEKKRLFGKLFNRG